MVLDLPDSLVLTLDRLARTRKQPLTSIMQLAAEEFATRSHADTISAAAGLWFSQRAEQDITYAQRPAQFW